MSSILLIEDDATLAYGVEYTLKSEGFEGTVANNLSSAREKAKKKYDLILLDVMLPDGSGYDFCREVRSSSDIPIIFLTASDEEVNIVMGLDMGADDYITKPFRIRELLSRIRAVLRRRKNIDAKVAAVVDKGILYSQYNDNGGIYAITTEKVYKNLTQDQTFNNVLIELEENADKEPAANYFKELCEKDPSYFYTDYVEQAKIERENAITVSIFLYGFVAVIALIGCLNIINTISTNLILRIRELSMMRAVGMTHGGIKKMVLMEGLFYGAISALYGGTLGTLFSYLLFRQTANIRGFAWSVPWNHLSIAILGAVLVALIASYIPLKKINRGNIIENIRMEE